MEKNVDYYTKSFIPRDDIAIQYVSLKERERRLASIEDFVNESMKGIEDYFEMSEERRITAANNRTGNICSERKKYKN